MASNLELYALFQDLDPENANQPLADSLRQKITAAVFKAVDLVVNESVATPNHTERVKWAARAVALPEVEAVRMLGVVLGANESLSVAQIKGASDAAIQNNVNAAIDTVAIGTA